MGGWDHGSPASVEHDSAATSARNSRYGLALFALYLALYGAFVLLSAFRPDVMEHIGWAGVNVAIWSGFGLIVSAMLLALVYGWLCRAAVVDAPVGDARR